MFDFVVVVVALLPNVASISLARILLSKATCCSNTTNMESTFLSLYQPQLYLSVITLDEAHLFFIRFVAASYTSHTHKKNKKNKLFNCIYLCGVFASNEFVAILSSTSYTALCSFISILDGSPHLCSLQLYTFMVSVEAINVGHKNYMYLKHITQVTE